MIDYRTVIEPNTHCNDYYKENLKLWNKTHEFGGVIDVSESTNSTCIW